MNAPNEDTERTSVAIAMLVMLWKCIAPEQTPMPEMIPRVQGYIIGNEPWIIENDPDSLGGVTHRRFNPSTSLVDAWCVVERMRRIGFHFWMRDENKDGVVAGFSKPDSTGRIQHYKSDPMPEPEAICVAALVAIGE